MPFTLHPQAVAEYEQATRYYADIQSELGLRFIERVELAFATIATAPDRWPIFEDMSVALWSACFRTLCFTE